MPVYEVSLELAREGRSGRGRCAMADRSALDATFTCYADFDLIAVEIKTADGELNEALTVDEATEWRDKLDAAIQEATEERDE